MSNPFARLFRPRSGARAAPRPEAAEGANLTDAQYRELFTKTREGFFVGELLREGGRAVDFRMLEVNEGFTLQTGRAAAEAIGRRISEVIPGFPQSVVERYGAVVDSGVPAVVEVEAPTLEARIYEARAHPLSGQRFAVLFLDITERKRIQRALEESRTFFNAVVDSVDQIVWSTLPDGYHDFFNRRWYEYTGVEPGSTDGEGWAELFHPDDRERTFATWRRSLETGQPYQIEYRLKHHSGGYRWVLGRAHAVRDETGAIIRWMGTCTDIHEQKTSAEGLEMAGKELRHRIKNVFAVISGLITLSARQRPECRQFAEELRERVLSLSQAHNYARPYGREGLGQGPDATVLGLVDLLLRPYAVVGEDRVKVVGDDAPLNPDATTPVSLAIHELATNAAKYGALSVSGGRVQVDGESRGGRFVLRWREEGGPPVFGPPERPSFGLRLVDLTLREQLGGDLVWDWRPEGLELRVSMPAEQIVEGAGTAD